MIKTQRFDAVTLAACVLVFAMSSRPIQAWDASFAAVAEVIQTRCMSCHDSETREGEIDLTPLLQKNNSSYGKYTNLWIKLENKVTRGEMPPPDEDPLKPSEKESIKNWFQKSFVLRKGKPHIGRTPLRRLTRYEFENTLEDVLSIKLKIPYRDVITDRIDLSRIQSTVPSDIPGPSGFDNDAQRMQSLKPPLKEIADAVHYALAKFNSDAAAIQAVLGRADLPTNASEDEVKQFISQLLLRAYRGNQQRVQDSVNVFYDLYHKHLRDSKDSSESLRHVFEMILVSPDFLYRFEESKDLDRPYPVTGLELATRLSYFLWSTAPDSELLRLAQNGSLPQDDVLKSQVARMLNSPKRIALSENFAGQWLGFDDLLSNREYLSSERWNRETYDEVLFFVDELIKSDRSFLELIQSDWIYKKSSARGYQKIDPESVQNLYANIFASRQSSNQDERTKYRGRFVRISHAATTTQFLTMSEVQVFSNDINIAPNGKATQSSNYTNSPASKAIDGNHNGSFATCSCTTEQLGSWWELDLGKPADIDSIAVWNRTDCCPERLDNISIEILDEQRQVIVTRTLKTSAVRNSLPEGAVQPNTEPRYDPPVLVKTRDDREGGIITSPAIMRLTASKDRTSPIRRGAWVLSTIIGKDLEPPPDVPSLKEARESLQVKENPSVAEVIKQHISKSECIICHRAIDPLGLGLENFAPTGEWRTLYPDQMPVQSAGVMPNGKTFKTPKEMKLLLLEMYQDDIANNFVGQMFAYALGRKSEPFDRGSLQQILRAVQEDGYKINTVIEQIVLSRQFRYRQDR